MRFFKYGKNQAMRIYKNIKGFIKKNTRLFFWAQKVPLCKVSISYVP